MYLCVRRYNIPASCVLERYWDTWRNCLQYFSLHEDKIPKIFQQTRPSLRSIILFFWVSRQCILLYVVRVWFVVSGGIGTCVQRIVSNWTMFQKSTDCQRKRGRVSNINIMNQFNCVQPFPPRRNLTLNVSIVFIKRLVLSSIHQSQILCHFRPVNILINSGCPLIWGLLIILIPPWKARFWIKSRGNYSWPNAKELRVCQWEPLFINVGNYFRTYSMG